MHNKLIINFKMVQILKVNTQDFKNESKTVFVSMYSNFKLYNIDSSNITFSTFKIPN